MKSKIYILFSLALLVLGGFFIFFIILDEKPVQVLDGEKDCAVLLHGLGRSSSSMEKLAAHLNQEGFRTVNIDYPSTKYPIKEIAKNHIAPAVSKYCNRPDEKIHFVAHSLGGILTRYYLANNDLENLGNVVLIAAPNRGSEMADFLSKSGVVSFVMGPALSELRTDSSSTSLNLPEPNYDVFVIAGNKSLNPIYSSLIHGVDDGKVSVESTMLENMKDFLIVPENHTSIMKSDQVVEAVTKFLKS